MNQPHTKLKVVNNLSTPKQIVFLKKMYELSAIPFCIMDKGFNALWSNQAMRHICPDIFCQGRFFKDLSISVQWLPDFFKSDGCIFDRYNDNSVFATNGFVLGQIPDVEDYYYLQAREVVDKGSWRQPKGTTQALTAFEYVMRVYIDIIYKDLRLKTSDLKRAKYGANNIYRIMLMTKDYTQLCNGLYPPASTYIELNSFCIETLDCIRRFIEKTGTQLKFSCDVGIYYTMSNATLLTTILCHLISNAVRYGNKKEVYVEVTLRNDELSFSITNWGFPIMAENLLHIYEPYKCFPPQGSGLYQGYGLGLTIAKAGAVFLGGGISGISQNDKTIFRLLLPALEYNNKYRIYPNNDLQGYPDRESLIGIILADCLE